MIFPVFDRHLAFYAIETDKLTHTNISDFMVFSSTWCTNSVTTALPDGGEI